MARRPRYAHAREEEVLAVERFRERVRFAIRRAMREARITRPELARRLEVSLRMVGLLLSRRTNLEVATIARVFHALGRTPDVVLSPYLPGSTRDPADPPSPPDAETDPAPRARI